MSLFSVTEIELGDVFVGSEVVVEFPYKDIKAVSKMLVFCDCTRIYNIIKDKKIVIRYTPKALPLHPNGYKIHKVATIFFTSDTLPGEEIEQTLSFRGKAIPRLQ